MTPSQYYRMGINDTVKSSEVTEDDLKLLMVGRELGSSTIGLTMANQYRKEVVLSVECIYSWTGRECKL